MDMNIGNAPCSWGTIEGVSGQRVGYQQMLDELAATGYQGTELGDWGFMPTDPDELRAELAARKVQLTGSWVTVRLYDEASHDQGIENAVRTARLLAEVGGTEAIINIGDDHGSVPIRHQNAGRIGPEHGLSDEGWQVYVHGAMRVAEAVKRETGLRSTLHPHGSTFVETPAEIERFLRLTDPELLGICFDTGHYALGGGDPVAGIRAYRERIWLVHFKDFDPRVVERAEVEGWNYQEMVGAGVFSELGRGVVDFPAVLEALHEIGYRGWGVVEQDVLPGMGSPKESAQRNRSYLQGIGS
ncbi:MAG: TIM barrel protein [Gemmatimonadota bacterium]|nr:MAG: TIM barrel protein [Gemmatimonadota bacterium]UCH25303.1 MAG: TIM barrel protein [Trueperaceae bacterium]